MGSIVSQRIDLDIIIKTANCRGRDIGEWREKTKACTSSKKNPSNVKRVSYDESRSRSRDRHLYVEAGVWEGRCKKTSTSSRMGVFNRKSICQSVEDEGWSTDLEEDSIDTDEDSESPGAMFLHSFDGLNRKITNRYSIGLDMLKAKIHHGADPTRMCTHGGRTALMFAVLADDYCFTKELVELGVDVNQTTPMGETALGFANEKGRNDIANYLRTKGALAKKCDISTYRTKLDSSF